MAIAIGPWRTIAGRMNEHSGGTSTTLHSIARRSASSNTWMLVSVSLVAAIARKWPSRSPGWKCRCVHSTSPDAASSATSGHASGAITWTTASAASSPSIFSRPTDPAPITRHRRPVRRRQAT